MTRRKRRRYARVLAHQAKIRQAVAMVWLRYALGIDPISAALLIIELPELSPMSAGEAATMIG